MPAVNNNGSSAARRIRTAVYTPAHETGAAGRRAALRRPRALDDVEPLAGARGARAPLFLAGRGRTGPTLRRRTTAAVLVLRGRAARAARLAGALGDGGAAGLALRRRRRRALVGRAVARRRGVVPRAGARFPALERLRRLLPAAGVGPHRPLFFLVGHGSSQGARGLGAAGRAARS